MCQRPELIAVNPGNTPTATAAALSRPSGCRHPNDPASTSSWNAAAMHAADNARPTATGASNTPGSGRRIFNPRSSSTASQPNATTRPAERTAHVNRQLRATSGATRTGRYRAIARMPNWPLPSPNRARRVTPSARLPTDPAGNPSATGDGTPAMMSHPCRPNNDDAHGRLATKATTDAATATEIMISAVRHEPPATSVLTASTTPRATTTRPNDGTKANTTAVNRASWHTIRKRARAGTCTMPSARFPSVRPTSARVLSNDSIPALRRKRCTTHGTVA